MGVTGVLGVIGVGEMEKARDVRWNLVAVE
jgi:hypothetical protein